MCIWCYYNRSAENENRLQLKNWLTPDRSCLIDVIFLDFRIFITLWEAQNKSCVRVGSCRFVCEVCALLRYDMLTCTISRSITIVFTSAKCSHSLAACLAALPECGWLCVGWACRPSNSQAASERGRFLYWVGRVCVCVIVYGVCCALRASSMSEDF